MILKGIRLGARLGKGHGLLLKEKYQESYMVLTSILQDEPDEYLLPQIHEDLGYVQYHLENYEESIRHMEFCIKSARKNPELWKDEKNLERVLWYYKASKEKLAEY